MDSQLTADGAALHLFFTDDVYLINEPGVQYDVVVNAVADSATSADKNRVAEPDVPEPVAFPIQFKYLGNNKRNILILVNDEQNEVSDEAGRELLRKIVKSVNLTANDFALLNYAKYKGTGFRQLLEHFSCNLVFSFGVTPVHLSMESPHPEYSIVLEGTVRMIFSAELKTLDQNPAAKKVLWGSLQSLGL
jgi:DNA polymerase III psi subunit